MGVGGGGAGLRGEGKRFLATPLHSVIGQMVEFRLIRQVSFLTKRGPQVQGKKKGNLRIEFTEDNTKEKKKKRKKRKN